MPCDEQEVLNEYARSSLRNTADQDYIAARMSFKARLIEPFLWSSLHAIEKYFKAILLFNTLDTRRFSHDIVKLFICVKEIKGFEFTFTNRAESFIRYLNEFGANRYFGYATYFESDALEELDHTIWNIRRYCFDINVELGNGIFPYRGKAYFEQYEKQPHKYKLRECGFLEKVIEKKLDAYPHLVRHNIYFGRYHRETIKNNVLWLSAENPTLFFSPEELKVLKKYVKL